MCTFGNDVCCLGRTSKYSLSSRVKPLSFENHFSALAAICVFSPIKLRKPSPTSKYEYVWIIYVLKKRRYELIPLPFLLPRRPLLPVARLPRFSPLQWYLSEHPRASIQTLRRSMKFPIQVVFLRYPYFLDAAM